MTNLNFYSNIASNSWAIFSVFSQTEFHKTNKYNITASTFITNGFNFKFDDTNLIKLVENKFTHIFVISDEFTSCESIPITIHDHTITIVKSNLKGILTDGILFKLTLDKTIIKHSLFIFLNYNWKDICKEFSSNGIIICGGSSTKRHIISPLHYRIVVGIHCFGFTYNDIVKSFSNIDKERSMPKDDLTKSINPSKRKEIILYSKQRKSNLVVKGNGSNGVLCSTPIKDIKGSGFSNFSTFSFNLTNNVSKDFSFYLDTLKGIIDKSQVNPYLAQKELESSWMNILRDKLLNSDLAVQSKLPSIFQKSKETLHIASVNGDLKRRFKDLAIHLNNDKFLVLTVGYLFSQYSFNKRNNIAMNIGSNILYELFRAKINDSKDFKSFKISISYYNLQDHKDDLNKIGRLGVYFINIFMNEHTYIFDENFVSETDSLLYNDSDINLIINPNYSDLIKDEIMLHPKSIPMICKPNLWGNNVYGGFLENSDLKESVITGSVYHNHDMKNMDSLYNAINYLNSIKFSINVELLNYLCGEGNSLINLLDGKALQDSKEVSDSEILQRTITFKLAEVYKNIPFYLNVHSDWRGRIYTHSFFISYQGGDLSSAILQFCEGQVLTETGLNYLYIYGANCFGKNGLDKLTFEEKIQWVKDNIANILKMDPLFLCEADSPYLFTAFCLNLRRLDKNPKAIINMPVFLDATCSGIQHLAGLLNDFNLGRKVNLVPSDTVNDLYSSMLKPINNNINKFGRDNVEFNSLSQVKLTRKIIKHPIMTKVYNVSIMGIKDQLINNFKKVKLDESTIRYEVPGIHGKVLLNTQEIIKIASIINSTIFEQFPSLKTIYDYFIEIVKVMVILEIPITWFTPSGLEITQSYSQSKAHKVSISFKGKSKTMVLRD